VFDDADDDDKYKYENLGQSEICFCRVGVVEKTCYDGVKVRAGETVRKKGVDLNSEGDFLNVTNLDATKAGEYKVSRD
jgi:hypothetical protein